MNIETAEATFHPNEVYQIAYAFFSEKIKELRLSGTLTKPILFDFYDVNISEPLEWLKGSSDESRVDFLEVISIMLWSLFRVWSKGVVDDGLGVSALGQINEQSVIRLFLENLDCDEGRALLEKVNKAQIK